MSDAPELGDQVKEIVTGYTGVVTGQAEYLWGCVQHLVHFRDQDGKAQSDWFDVGRLEVIEKAALRPVVHGGPKLRAVTGGEKPPAKPA